MRHTNPDDKPAALEVLVDQVPEALKALDQWVVWRWIWNAQRGQWDKPPMQTDGSHAKSTDPATWCTFEAAIASAHPGGRWDGIGFVLTPEAGIVGIDFDDCRDPETGDLEEWAMGWLTELQTYTEASPSGLGVRAFALATLPPGRRKAGPIEVYIQGRYLTVTGQRLGRASEPQARQVAVDTLHATLAPEPAPEASAEPAAPPTSTLLELPDRELLERASTAKNGVDFWQLYRGQIPAGKTASESTLGLLNHLAFWTAKDAARMDRLFRASGQMRPKWDERRGDTTWGQEQIATAIAGVTDVYTPLGEAGELRSEPNGLNGHAPTSDEPPELKLRWRTARQLADETPEQATWVVEGLIAQGAITEIDGPAKTSGKTTFLSHLLRAKLDGKPFLERATLAGPVVLLTEEGSATFRQALRRGKLTERDDVHVLLWKDTAGTDWPAVIAEARLLAGMVGANLLVVDTLPGMVGMKGEQENDSGEANKAMEPLRLAAGDGELGVLLTRHDRRAGGTVGESGRGSTAFTANVDIVLRLTRLGGEGRGHMRQLEGIGRFDEIPDAIVIELTDEGYVAHGSEDDMKAKEARRLLLEALPDNPSDAVNLPSLWKEDGPLFGVISDKGVKGEISQRWVRDTAEDMERAGILRRVVMSGRDHRWFVAEARRSTPSGVIVPPRQLEGLQ